MNISCKDGRHYFQIVDSLCLFKSHGKFTIGLFCALVVLASSRTLVPWGNCWHVWISRVSHNFHIQGGLQRTKDGACGSILMGHICTSWRHMVIFQRNYKSLLYGVLRCLNEMNVTLQAFQSPLFPCILLVDSISLHHNSVRRSPWEATMHEQVLNSRK